MCIKNLFANSQDKLIWPDPPHGSVQILGSSAIDLLAPYGIALSGGAADYGYLLMTGDEANCFMAWYKKNAPIKPGDYTPDNLDCDDFAWIMRAYALVWSRGKYLWGYTEAEGADPAYPFPNHGFNFLITADNKVWFADPLSVAASDNEIMEAYPVRSFMAKC
jgi:hypothetical protein